MSASRSEHRDPVKLAQDVLAGNRLAIARAITLVENEQPGARVLLSTLFPHTGRAHIIGVTGAPGTGKSTLVTALVQTYRAAGYRVGVVAIDPTSPYTGGALLGDRVRMRALSGDTDVFIRSMATRGSLGGLAKPTDEVVQVLDAAGFERVIIETVGVGQAEVEIAATAHTTLVVEAPGLGDEVQAIKAGILEIADVLVVNKADRPGVDRTTRALSLMLELETDVPRSVGHHGIWTRLPLTIPEGANAWPVTIHQTIAVDGEGVERLYERIEAHRQWLTDSGELATRERLRIVHALEALTRAELTRRLANTMPQAGLDALIESIRRRELDLYDAIAHLLSGDKE